MMYVGRTSLVKKLKRASSISVTDFTSILVPLSYHSVGALYSYLWKYCLTTGPMVVMEPSVNGTVFTPPYTLWANLAISDVSFTWPTSENSSVCLWLRGSKKENLLWLCTASIVIVQRVTTFEYEWYQRRDIAKASYSISRRETWYGPNSEC